MSDDLKSDLPRVDADLPPTVLRPGDSVELSFTLTFDDREAYDRLLYGARPQVVGEVVGGRWDGQRVRLKP